MGYLFWHKGRRSNEAAWRWLLSGVPPADLVVEALPEGQSLLVIPRRERYAANRAYAVDVLPIPPDVVSESELQRALLVVPRRELRTAYTAYELRDNAALRPDREKPIEIGQLESRAWRWPRRTAWTAYELHDATQLRPDREVPIEIGRLWPEVWRWPTRTAATAYTLYDAPQLRPDREKPIEIGALWPYVFQPRRTSATAYQYVVIPIAEGLPLPEELRRSVLVIPTRLRLAARSAYDLYQFPVPLEGALDIIGPVTATLDANATQATLAKSRTTATLADSANKADIR